MACPLVVLALLASAAGWRIPGYLFYLYLLFTRCSSYLCKVRAVVLFCNYNSCLGLGVGWTGSSLSCSTALFPSFGMRRLGFSREFLFRMNYSSVH